MLKKRIVVLLALLLCICSGCQKMTKDSEAVFESSIKYALASNMYWELTYFGSEVSDSKEVEWAKKNIEKATDKKMLCSVFYMNGGNSVTYRCVLKDLKYSVFIPSVDVNIDKKEIKMIDFGSTNEEVFSKAMETYSHLGDFDFSFSEKDIQGTWQFDDYAISMMDKLKEQVAIYVQEKYKKIGKNTFYIGPFKRTDPCIYVYWEEEQKIIITTMIFDKNLSSEFVYGVYDKPDNKKDERSKVYRMDFEKKKKNCMNDGKMEIIDVGK